MKKYKVLEAHQGDKFYKPGDPETGTRIADPNAVGHLVTLGLLEEIGDVVADEPFKEEAGASVDDLRAQVVALTQERDDACRDLEAFGTNERAMQSAATALREQFEAMTDERDGLREQLATVTGERDAHAQRVTGLEGELAAAKAAPPARTARAKSE